MIGHTFKLQETDTPFGASEQPHKRAGLWAINPAWLAEFTALNPTYAHLNLIENRQVVLHAVTTMVMNILTQHGARKLNRDVAVVLHWDQYSLDIVKKSRDPLHPVRLYFVCSESHFNLEEWSLEPPLGDTQPGEQWGTWNVSEPWADWASKKVGIESWTALTGHAARDKRRQFHALLKDRLARIFNIPSTSVGVMIDWDEFAMLLVANDFRLASKLSFMTNIRADNFAEIIREHGKPEVQPTGMPEFSTSGLVNLEGAGNLLPEEGDKANEESGVTGGVGPITMSGSDLQEIVQVPLKEAPAGTQVVLVDKTMQESKLNVVDATGGPGFLG